MAREGRGLREAPVLQLRALPAGKAISYETFADRLIEAAHTLDFGR